MLMPKDAILFKIVLKCAKECLILKYKYIQNPWFYVLWHHQPSEYMRSCRAKLIGGGGGGVGVV